MSERHHSSIDSSSELSGRVDRAKIVTAAAAAFAFFLSAALLRETGEKPTHQKNDAKINKIKFEQKTEPAQPQKVDPFPFDPIDPDPLNEQEKQDFLRQEEWKKAHRSPLA